MELIVGMKESLPMRRSSVEPAPDDSFGEKHEAMV
jgi:hypothetical protein